MKKLPFLFLNFLFFSNLAISENILKIDASKELHKMPETFYGIFYEDINYSADGGLYSELIQNRSFEYNVEEIVEQFAGCDINSHTDALLRSALRHTPPIRME